MWISKKVYEDLVNERDAYRAASEGFHSLYDKQEAEIDSLKKKNECLDNINKNYSEEFAELVSHSRNLLDMLNNVINFTFEGNTGFETVIFQRYGHKPQIFYKGKEINLKLKDQVRATFQNGITSLKKNETM